MTSRTPRIVIWGASGHAMVVADIIRQRNELELLGFLDDIHPERRGEEFFGGKVLGGREQLGELDRRYDRVIVAIGNCKARFELANIAQSQGLELISAIHPRATIAEGVTIGAGSVVAAGAVLNPAVCLAENVIVNTCASVDHHGVVGVASHIAPGARLAGNVRVGRTAWIGIGSIIIEGRSIGDNSVIGAGAVVVRDIPANVVAYGVPAKVMRKVNETRHENQP